MPLLVTLMILTFSLLFLKSKHPLAMGIIMMIQTTLICLAIPAHHPSSWFSYILFLIFMGAILVLFIYVATLAANNMFNLPVKTLIAAVTLLSLIYLSFLTADFMMTSPLLSSPLSAKTTLNNLFNPASMPLLLFIVMFLLMNLIVVVRISTKVQGPLRKTNSN